MPVYVEPVPLVPFVPFEYRFPTLPAVFGAVTGGRFVGVPVGTFARVWSAGMLEPIPVGFWTPSPPSAFDATFGWGRIGRDVPYWLTNCNGDGVGFARPVVA
jgi:hypothetical protein